MTTMYPTDPPQYDDGEGGFTFEPQTEPKWQFTEEGKDVIRELADEVIDDLRVEVIELRERTEELERQVNTRREPSGTPADKADSLLKHLASTGVIRNYKHIDGNKHFDQVLKDICELFIRYDKATP